MKSYQLVERMWSWWRHQMETFSALLALCAGNSPVTGEFPAQRPVTRSFDVFFDLRLNKRLSKQSWCWWFETPSHPLWRHCNVIRNHKDSLGGWFMSSRTSTKSIWRRYCIWSFQRHFLQQKYSLLFCGILSLLKWAQHHAQEPSRWVVAKLMSQQMKAKFSDTHPSPFFEKRLIKAQMLFLQQTL